MFSSKSFIVSGLTFRSLMHFEFTFVMAQRVKHLSTIWETWVQALGWEDPVEEGTATHSSILAWRIPGTEEPGGLPSMGS